MMIARLSLLQCLLTDDRDRHHDGMKLDFSGFHAGQVENVIDNIYELFAAAMNQLNIAPLTIVEVANDRILEQLGQSQ